MAARVEQLRCSHAEPQREDVYHSKGTYFMGFVEVLAASRDARTKPQRHEGLIFPGICMGLLRFFSE